jgi:hypothetical protein
MDLEELLIKYAALLDKKRAMVTSSIQGQYECICPEEWRGQKYFGETMSEESEVVKLLKGQIEHEKQKSRNRVVFVILVLMIAGGIYSYKSYTDLEESADKAGRGTTEERFVSNRFREQQEREQARLDSIKKLVDEWSITTGEDAPPPGGLDTAGCLYLTNYLPKNPHLDGSENYFAEVKAAIEAAASQHKQLFVPEGSILVDIRGGHNIELTQNVRVRGMGRKSILMTYPTATNDNQALFYLSGTTARVDHITIKGPDAHPVGNLEWNAFVLRRGTSALTLRDVKIDGWVIGIRLGSGPGYNQTVTMDLVEVAHCAQGILGGGTGENDRAHMFIDSCIFRDQRYQVGNFPHAGYEHAIYVALETEMRLTNTAFVNIPGVGSHPYDESATGYEYVAPWTIENCFFANVGNGILFRYQYGAADTVRNCTFDSCVDAFQTIHGTAEISDIRIGGHVSNSGVSGQSYGDIYSIPTNPPGSGNVNVTRMSLTVKNTTNDRGGVWIMEVGSGKSWTFTDCDFYAIPGIKSKAITLTKPSAHVHLVNCRFWGVWPEYSNEGHTAWTIGTGTVDTSDVHLYANWP